jgi:hypothetical protein
LPAGRTAESKPGAAQKPLENEYPLVLRGYIFADEADALELKLFDLILSLNGSGFIRRVEVLNKENKTVRGRPVLEFALSARCWKYEL